MIRVILAGGAILAAWHIFKPRLIQRQLNELGTITLPKRLEPRRTREDAGSARFKFERDAGSFRLIGAPHTNAERLAIGVWTPATHAQTRKETIWLAQDAVDSKSLRWRAEAGFEIGEGLYQTGVDARSAYVIVKEDTTHQITIAYMAWQSTTSLQDARKLVDSALASYQPSRPVDDYLKIAEDRPAKLKAERRAVIHGFLKAKAIQPQVDSDVVEHDGILYAHFTHSFWGPMFASFLPLGVKPVVTRYYAATQWNGMVLWFSKENGAWQPHGIYGETPILPDSFTRYLDTYGDPERANFFAIHIDRLDDIDSPTPDPDFLFRQSAQLKQRFAAGDWIKPWE